MQEGVAGRVRVKGVAPPNTSVWSKLDTFVSSIHCMSFHEYLS